VRTIVCQHVFWRVHSATAARVELEPQMPPHAPTLWPLSLFAKVGLAYAALSDGEKRRVYDAHGEEGLKRQEQRGGGGGGGASSIFEAFGFGSRGGGRAEQRTAKVTIPLRVTLRELYLGATFEVTYQRKVLCMKHRECQRSCPDCIGPGARQATRQIAPGFVQQVRRGSCWQSKCCNKSRCARPACRAYDSRGTLKRLASQFTPCSLLILCPPPLVSHPLSHHSRTLPSRNGSLGFPLVPSALSAPSRPGTGRGREVRGAGAVHRGAVPRLPQGNPRGHRGHRQRRGA